MQYKVSVASKVLKGTIRLDGSKSISNRVLIQRALSGQDFAVNHIANSSDTKTMLELLASDSDLLDAHDGGTTFRFLTAFLSVQEGRTVTLTGAERMKQRPIKILAEALKTLGAEIEY